jgi:hypothetical protein
MTLIVVLGYYAHDFTLVPVKDPVVSKCLHMIASNALEPILAHIRFLAYYDVLHSYLLHHKPCIYYTTPNSIYCTIPRGRT